MFQYPTAPPVHIKPNPTGFRRVEASRAQRELTTSPERAPRIPGIQPHEYTVFTATGRNHEHHDNIRMNEQDAELIRKFARFEGVTISDFAHAAILEKIEDSYDLRIADRTPRRSRHALSRAWYGRPSRRGDLQRERIHVTRRRLPKSGKRELTPRHSLKA